MIGKLDIQKKELGQDFCTVLYFSKQCLNYINYGEVWLSKTKGCILEHRHTFADISLCNYKTLKGQILSFK